MKAHRVRSSKGNGSEPMTSKVYEELEIAMENRTRRFLPIMMKSVKAKN